MLKHLEAVESNSMGFLGIIM